MKKLSFLVACALVTFSLLAIGGRLASKSTAAQKRTSPTMDVQLGDLGPVRVSSAAFTLDFEERNQHRLTLTVTNITDKPLSALNFKLVAYTQEGKVRGGAEWNLRAALEANGKTTISILAKIELDEAKDRLALSWSDKDKKDKKTSQHSFSGERLHVSHFGANFIPVAQQPPCPPFPCGDASSYCQGATNSAIIACGGSQNNPRLASFNCSVSCTSCSYSFTCK